MKTISQTQTESRTRTRPARSLSLAAAVVAIATLTACAAPGPAYETARYPYQPHSRPVAQAPYVDYGRIANIEVVRSETASRAASLVMPERRWTVSHKRMKRVPGGALRASASRFQPPAEIRAGEPMLPSVAVLLALRNSMRTRAKSGRSSSAVRWRAGASRRRTRRCTRSSMR